MYSKCVFTDQRRSVHTLCNDLGHEAQLGPRSAEEREAQPNKVGFCCGSQNRCVTCFRFVDRNVLHSSSMSWDLYLRTQYSKSQFMAFLYSFCPWENVFPRSAVSEQTTHQKSQREDSQAAEGRNRDEDLNKFLQEHKARDCAEKTHHHQPEGEQKSANGSSAPPRQLSPSGSCVAPSISPVQQVEEGEASSCHCFAPIVADTQDGELFGKKETFSVTFNITL